MFLESLVNAQDKNDHALYLEWNSLFKTVNDVCIYTSCYQNEADDVLI